MSDRVVTVVIHGTFARNATWWQLGNPDAPTFADKLEEGLAADGIVDSVWKPALNAGMAYEDFTWSGNNRHKDRVAGARKISRSLGDLANRLGATASDPLHVNAVAHSHGGNVALEMLKYLPRNVRTRRITMLGTPLVWRRASGRLYALVLAIVFFGFLITAAVTGVQEEQQSEPVTGIGLWFFIPYLLVMMGLVLGPYMWAVQHPFRWIDRSLAWLVSLVRRGGPAGVPAHGPSPHRLARLVDQAPTLITSREDEADLALHIGASPRDVYAAFVKGKLTGKMRFLEPLYLRGPFSVVIAPILEAMTEHYVLGFRWRSVAFNNYEMVDFAVDGPYGQDTIRRLDVSEDLVPILIAKLAQWRPTAMMIAEDRADQTERERHLDALRATILGVVTDISRQMQLRHTVYYETDSVVSRTADSLVDLNPR